MDAQTFATMMALLAIVTIAGTVAVVVGRVARVPALQLEAGGAMTAAWAIAAVATAGSLTLSEVFHFTPCELCWYQRIAMYPLVVVLGVGAWRRDLSMRLPALLLAGIGAALSTWHVLVQRVPAMSNTTSCDATAPCTAIWVDVFQIFTIPTMALAGFVGIIALVATAQRTTP
jgi:disulfide bond formation protein DsbB